jgi:homoserine O-acetyltransferase/O-succinyltransferase
VSEHSPSDFAEPNDGPDGRRFVPLFSEGLQLEGGGRLDSVDVAYEEWGTLNPGRTNAVLVLHALTGDSHATGQAGIGDPNPGWWDDLLGPGAAIDTDRFFVVCPNVLGGCGGTTGPSSPAQDGNAYGSRFPAITIRDQVEVEVALADHLGIDQWAAVIGGSMGGMRALEWCVGQPERVDRALVLAVGAAASAEQIALCSLQVRAIRADPAYQGGDYYDTSLRPTEGMAIARGIGQVSYRTSEELEARFGHGWQGDESPLQGGRYAVESYLAHHGDKLAARFDPNSYVVLSQAMNHHDIGRGRHGISSALQQVTAEVTVAGIATDRLYPIESQHEIARLLDHGTEVRVINSRVGHDGFLIEVDAVGTILKEVLV